VIRITFAERCRQKAGSNFQKSPVEAANLHHRREDDAGAGRRVDERDPARTQAQADVDNVLDAREPVLGSSFSQARSLVNHTPGTL